MEFAQIFTEMSWIPAVLLSLGIIFTIVEVIVPGFGFFGVAGIGCLIAGIVVRIVQGLTVVQSIVLILLVLGFFIIAGVFMVFSAQYGVLSQTGLFETNPTIRRDYDKAEKELRKLIGKSGRAISKLNLGGKAKIKGKIYDVISATSLITPGAHIKVIAIKDNHIIVRKWFE